MIGLILYRGIVISLIFSLLEELSGKLVDYIKL